MPGGSTRCVPVNSAGCVQWGGAALYRVYSCTAVQSAGTVSQSNSHSHVPPALSVNSDTAFIADRQ